MNDRAGERPLWAILRAARERVVERYPSGAKAASNFHAGGDLVGKMLWEENGNPSWGWTLRNGEKHGLSLEWWANGALSFSEPYVDGLVHGMVRHWDDEGELLLETRYVRGTGVDLWCDLHSRALAEEARFRCGKFHGYRRMWRGDSRSVWLEEHYVEGVPHGVFREWNGKGRIRRGFPRYFVRGVRATRRAYLRAAKTDATLPPWREKENQPKRSLPRELVGQPLHEEMRRRRRKQE